MLSAGFHENGIDFMLGLEPRPRDAGQGGLAQRRVLSGGPGDADRRGSITTASRRRGSSCSPSRSSPSPTSTTCGASPARRRRSSPARCQPIWGVGAGGWMGLNLEPLTLVVPVLADRARAQSLAADDAALLRNSLRGQRQERWPARRARWPRCSRRPVLGIMCDVAGLYMTILAPIPIVQKLGVLCGTWSLLIIPSA